MISHFQFYPLIMWFEFLSLSSWNLEGHGVIKSDGGDGAQGASGGRIAIHLKTEIYFFGTHQALGGSGSGCYLTAGGPGSIYIEDKR